MSFQEYLSSFNLATSEWLLAMLCGMLIGMAKTGLSGAGLAVVPIFVMIFGGKPSTGFLLPMLIFADIFAVSYYNRHANWKHVFKLLPWAIAGIIFALLVGETISDKQFKQVISITVIAGIIILIWRDSRKNRFSVPNYWWFSSLMGLAGGFATMIGNAAGPIMTVYLLSMRLPKNNYIGTAAWFFFIVNVFKVPLHVFFWETITIETIFFDLLMIPSILLGVFTGIAIVRIIPENIYRLLLILSTVLSALILF